MADKDSTPTIEFAPGSKSRFCEVPLDFPLLIDGKKLKAVTVHRLTAKAVGEVQAGLEENGFSFDALMQPFTDQPQEVLDALDQDDYAKVEEAVLGFLPVKMRAALENMRAEMEAMVQAKMDQAAEQEIKDASSPGEV
mgnify:CR=1 FL=1